MRASRLFPRHVPSTIPTGVSSRCVSGVIPGLYNAPDNWMTTCIKSEMVLLERIVFDPAFPLLKVAERYRLLADSPFDEMPIDAIRLNIVNLTPTLLSTLVAGILAPIVNYIVPSGYDGVLNSLYTRFTPTAAGTALQDGSGQLVWHIIINNHLALGYNNITIQQGDSGSLGAVTHGGGIRIKANDNITIAVVVNAAGIATLDPNGIILGAMQGWIYPNR